MESEDELLSHLTSAIDGRVYSPSRSANNITEEIALVPLPIGYATLYTITVHFDLVTSMIVGVLREKDTDLMCWEF